jgi:hypothetical protein
MRRAYAHAPSLSKPGEILFLYVAADTSRLEIEARIWCAENIGENGVKWTFNDLGDIIIYMEDGFSDAAFAFKLRWC